MRRWWRSEVEKLWSQCKGEGKKDAQMLVGAVGDSRTPSTARERGQYSRKKRASTNRR